MGGTWVQLFGKRQPARPVGSAFAGQHDSQPGHEVARTCVPPGMDIRRTTGGERQQLRFVVAVERVGECRAWHGRCIADGQRWIIDYKTVRAPQEELLQRAESFRPQLERYASLFAGEGLPIRLAVWFGLQGELVEIGR